MGRRSDHTREELHELALAKATEIAEMEGLRGISARRIAREIGYTIGTIYNLFDDLDDLIVHLNGQTLDALYAELSKVPLIGKPDADVRTLSEVYVQFVSDHPRLWNVLFEHRLPDGQLLPEWHNEKIMRLLGRVENAMAPLYSPGQKEERLHDARVLWSSLHGICSLESAGKLAKDESIRTMIETLIVYFLAGLRTKAASEIGNTKGIGK